MSDTLEVEVWESDVVLPIDRDSNCGAAEAVILIFLLCYLVENFARVAFSEIDPS